VGAQLAAGEDGRQIHQKALQNGFIRNLIGQKKKRQSSRITHEALFVGLPVPRDRNTVAGELPVAGGGISAQTRQLPEEPKAYV
jgi:hypothetical protein